MLKVIIVEDELTVRRGLVLTTPWENYGCEVVGEAKNGKEGKAMIESLRPDIVITDIKMPIMDGLEMIQSIDKSLNVEFIVLTAFRDFEFAQKAIRLGAIDYLLKPFSDVDLENAIKKSIIRIEERQDKIQKKSQTNVLEALDLKLKKSENSKEDNIIKVKEYVNDHFGEEINIQTVCELINVSESYLIRLFKSEMGYTFHEFLISVRMKRACEILLDPHIKIYEVAHKVGYTDQRYFSTVFKKNIGVTPVEFKEHFITAETQQKTES